MVEDGLHVQRPAAGVFRDVVGVLLVELFLQCADAGQAAVTVHELLDNFGHAPYHHVRAPLGKQVVVQIPFERLFECEGLAHLVKGVFLHSCGPAELLEIHGAHLYFRRVPYGEGTNALELRAQHGA